MSDAATTNAAKTNAAMTNAFRPVPLTVDRLEGPVDGSARTPLVIAHGLFGSKRNFGSLARRFAARRPVITVDMRNHGESPWDDGMDYRALGADLLATIQAEAGGRALVLGHSMGGKAAMAAALLQPEAVAALAVADIAPIAYRNEEHGAILDAMASADLTEAQRRSDVEPALADAAPDPSLRAFLMQNLLVETAADGGRSVRWRLNLTALRAALPDLIGWPLALAEARYGGPVRLIAGGRSDYVTAAGATAAAALFPMLDRVTLDTGHWPHAEAPDAFFDAAAPWLDAQDAAAA